MKSGVESRVNSFKSELEKFSARWHQLKPNDDVIESNDKSKLSQAIEAIKNRKEEFAELNKNKDQLL